MFRSIIPVGRTVYKLIPRRYRLEVVPERPRSGQCRSGGIREPVDGSNNIVVGLRFGCSTAATGGGRYFLNGRHGGGRHFLMVCKA